MTNQVNQAFEKYFPRPTVFSDKAHEIATIAAWNSARINWEVACYNYTQASESEINSLKQRVEELEAANSCLVRINVSLAKESEELTEYNNKLREALEGMVESYQYEASSENESLLNAFKVLESTTAQSLAEHDNATIDRCKNIVADDALAITFQSMGAYRSAIIKQIGELKATP